MHKDILDVFYNCLIKEASVGSVDCYFTYNMRFDTVIREDDVSLIKEEDQDNLLVPTLMIKDKKEFNSLLNEYVELALKFYDDYCFPEEVRYCNYMENELGISKEKMIMTLLWSNAVSEDFNDPCNFLRKRIAFFDLGVMEKYLNESVISYSEVLNADISVRVLKNGLESETPYSLRVRLLDPVNEVDIYEFPRVYFGIYDNSGYVYAIQNSKDRLIREAYVKKFDRLMYKVNDGLDVKVDNNINYGSGNLKDITPNAVVSANVLMGLFNLNNINKIIIPSILISRWNAKMLVLDKLKKRGKKTSEEIKDAYDKYLYLQTNLTEKFLRTFRRIAYHHSSVMVRSYPYDFNSSLELGIIDEVDVCNNKLLEETYNFETNDLKRAR